MSGWTDAAAAVADADERVITIIAFVGLTELLTDRQPDQPTCDARRPVNNTDIRNVCWTVCEKRLDVIVMYYFYSAHHPDKLLASENRILPIRFLRIVLETILQ